MVIGIYPRKSVYRDNSDSVQVQVQMCKEYAGVIYRGKELDFRIYDRDEGFSGKNMNRPSFQELMCDVKAGLLDSVMVYKLDRISRNVQEFASMYEVFQRHNVSFISVKESFDTTTPMGRTVMYILAAFAQLERENTSERVSDSMQSLGASGKWTGGVLPTGFTSERRKDGAKEHSYLVVDPDTVGVVKQIFDLITSGYTITGVERYFTAHNIRTAAGNWFGTSQLHSLIRNPVYCQNSLEAYYYLSEKGCTLPDRSLFDGKHGLIGYGRTKTAPASQESCPMDKWIIAVGTHQPVIPAKQWIEAQQRIGINSAVRASKWECGLLRGVLRCSCGARIDIRTYRKGDLLFSYYYCSDMARKGKSICNSGYVRVETVDASFLQQLQELRLDPSSIRLRTDSRPAKNPRTIRAEMNALEKSIRNLTSALTQAMDTAAAGYIIDQIGELAQQKSALETSLRMAEAQALAEKALADTERDIYERICYLLDNIDIVGYHAKNELIRKIVKKCILDSETGDLHIVF